MRITTPTRSLASALAIAAALSWRTSIWAQDQGFEPYKIAGTAIASQYGSWRLRVMGGIATPAILTLVTTGPDRFTIVGGAEISALSALSPVLYTDTVGNQETITPTSVSCKAANGPCAFFAVFASSHPAGGMLQSATAGIDEAAASLPHGGTVLLTPDWNGTTSQFAAAVLAPNVLVHDVRPGKDAFYGAGASGHPSLLWSVTGNGVAASTLVAENFEQTLYADQFAGNDAGAKMSACLAALPPTGGTCDATALSGPQSGAALVVVPPYATLRMGAMTYTTNAGFQVEPGTNATLAAAAAALVGQGSATTIIYGGTGDAIHAFNAAGVGQFNTRVRLSNFQINGTAAGAAGIDSQDFQFGDYDHITVTGFTSGSAFINKGASSVHCRECSLVLNHYGWHDIDDDPSIPTNNTFIGGQIQQSGAWGIYEDGTNNGGDSPPVSNGAIGTTFIANGPAAAAGGDAFFQSCDGCFMINNYEEQLLTPPASSYYHMQLGDSTFNATGTVIFGNSWLTATMGPHMAYHDVQLENAFDTNISNNIEEGAVGALVYSASAATVSFTQIVNNSGLAADTVFGGLDNGNTLQIGGASAGLVNPALANSIQPTPNGIGINNLTGADRNLAIRGRGTDPASVLFQTSDTLLEGAWLNFGTSKGAFAVYPLGGSVGQLAGTWLDSPTGAGSDIRFNGSTDGIGYYNAKITGQNDAAAVGYGSLLRFFTEQKASGTSDSSTEKLRITAAGNVCIQNPVVVDCAAELAVGSSYQFSVNAIGAVSAPSLTLGGGSPLTTSNQITGAGTSNPNYIVLNSAMPLVGTTVAIGGTPLGAGQCTSGTAAVPGATTAMHGVTWQPASDPQVDASHGLAIVAFVSAPNAVTVRVCALVATTPNAVSFTVAVVQ